MIDLSNLLDELVAKNPYPKIGQRAAPLAPPRCAGMHLRGMKHPAKCAGSCEQILPRRMAGGEEHESKYVPVYFAGLCATCSRREQDERAEARVKLAR